MCIYTSCAYTPCVCMGVCVYTHYVYTPCVCMCMCESVSKSKSLQKLFIFINWLLINIISSREGLTHISNFFVCVFAIR